MYLTSTETKNLLNKKDLTQDPLHCISILVEIIKERLQKKYSMAPNIEVGERVVSIQDNYYNLGYQNNEVTLGTRYTKYLSKETILRTQMSSAIPQLLRSYKHDGDKLWMCPGLVYRRDVKDKTHVGEPHQLDIWYLTDKAQNREDLLELVSLIITVIEEYSNMKIKWRYNETSHNYTDNGIEVEIYYDNKWLEILECGLISKKILANHGLQNYHGLALGMGLERLVMIIKNIYDIRILYSENPSIKKQLSNLKKYKPVSHQPAIKRDLSIAVDRDLCEEELTELILEQIPVEIQMKIESIKIIEETYYEQLPEIAIQRLGMVETQKNVLLRVIIRDVEKTLTNTEANYMYEEIYNKIHGGSAGYSITNSV